jgi:Lrp/AsnC family leucine-responsive transcriptional regulator
VAQLSKQVHMSASAVTERLRRLEEAGVISAYRAEVDPTKLGYDILAFLRLRYPSSNYTPLHRLLDSTPEVLEAHHVTGHDCFILKIVATSMRTSSRSTVVSARSAPSPPASPTPARSPPGR